RRPRLRGDGSDLGALLGHRDVEGLREVLLTDRREVGEAVRERARGEKGVHPSSSTSRAVRRFTTAPIVSPAASATINPIHENRCNDRSAAIPSRYTANVVPAAQQMPPRTFATRKRR